MTSRDRWSRLLRASAGSRVGRELPVRSLAFDGLVMVVVAGLGAVLLTVIAQREGPVDFVFVVAISLPLAIRRRFPRVAVLLVFAVAIVQAVLGVRIGLYDAALLFALYTAVGSTNRRFGLVALAAGLVTVVVGAATGWWSWMDQQLGTGAPGFRAVSTAGALLLTVGAWALGERLRSSRLGAMALADRAVQLEREAGQQAELAAAAERARIAREMHDVIAHGLSVMIVQADGAAYVVDTSPALARQALVQISATGRESLGQMRNLLGLLRDGGAGEAGSAPQPDLQDLPALVEEARAAGAQVEVSGDTDPTELSAMVSLTAYRAIQEALTNARKHGGRLVSVRLDRGPAGLRIRVADSGAGGRDDALTQQPGHGLTGLRERVAAAGGTAETGPDDRGGFVVDVWLPTGEERIDD